jgi:hypothetical protein
MARGVRLGIAMAKRETRCWPGYEPVKGKKKNEQGSCRKKAESKSTAGEKEFQAKRKQQIDRWQAAHPGTRRSAAQHLAKPGATPKKASARKRPAKKRSASRS